MKNLFNIKFIFFVVLLFSISACEKDEVDSLISECNEPQNQITPPEIRTFNNLSCLVKWKDGSYVNDLTVVMKIYKEYCDGTQAGVYRPEGTIFNGVWYSQYMANYTFKNVKDRVVVQFIVAPGSYDWKYDFVYRWEDVENKPYAIDDNFTLNLPINEDGT